jgi:hypothetical protein
VVRRSGPRLMPHAASASRKCRGRAGEQGTQHRVDQRQRAVVDVADDQVGLAGPRARPAQPARR